MNSSPTALFESYELEFQQITETVGKRLEEAALDDRAGEWLVYTTQC